MFSEIFINRPRFAIVISILIILGGVLCLFELPVAEYPEVTPPQVSVTTTYPGASAQVIADTVASVIEKQVNGVENMLYFSSKSSDSGNYELSISFASGTDSDIAQVNVQNAIQRATNSLPEDVKKNGVNVKKRSSDILAAFAFSSTNHKHDKLFVSNYVSINVSDTIARVRGVSDVMIFGAWDYSMRIWLDPYRMASMGVRPDEVASAIKSQNLQAAAGAVGSEMSSDYMQFKVNATGRLVSAEDFASIIIRSGDTGQQVRLGDIARIELGSDSYSGENFLNGKPAVVMAIYRNNSANANSVVDNVNQEIARLKQYFPEGLEVKLVYDPTEFIRTTMHEIAITLIMTLLLVVAITYLFLQDWRATLVPTAAIPVSIIGTFIVMKAFGYSINVLTMFGLILVIGSVVDDAIVVVENTMRLIEEEHLSAREAALKTMKQVSGALIATTLVVLAVYAPLSFSGGMVGIIYRQFSLTMCAALVISTFIAFTLSPSLCALLLRPHRENKLFRPFNFSLDLTRNTFLFFAKILTRRILLTAILFGGVLFLNYYFFNKMPPAFLPTEDKGVLFGAVQLQPGATLGRTKEVMLNAEKRIREVPGVKDVMTICGFSMVGGNSENVGMMFVILDNWSLRTTPDKSVQALMAKIQGACMTIPSARIDLFMPPAIMGLGMTGGVSAVLQATEGQSPAELYSTLQGYIGALMQQPGTAYAFSAYEANTPQIFLEIDRPKAEALGVPVDRIFTTLQSKLSSFYVNDFNLYGYTYKVKMEADRQYRANIEDIEQINVQNDNGKLVPISTICRAKMVVGPRQIMRFNQFLSADLNVMSKPFFSSGQMMAKMEELEKTTLPKGYRINWTDMSYQEHGNQGKIVFLMALALIFGYLFLVAQYESWTIPVPVIISVAMATLGAILGLMMMKMPLSIYAQLGLVMLVGLASKNAILMVEFSKQQREAGVPIVEAALQGAKTRYRAVLMTAWSFVLGVFPLVIATGAGSGSRRAIGVPTFWGMLLATVVGIIFIPALYVAFQVTQEKITGWVNRKKPE